MTDPTVYEHPYPETTGNDFLEDARVVYGDEEAFAIGAAIITRASYAQAVLPLIRRYDTQFSLGVMHPPGMHDRGHAVHAWASCSENQITLMLNPDAPVDRIVRDLHRAIPHEFGHLAHYQLNPSFDHVSHEPDHHAFFRTAVSEGIARSAEVLDFGDQHAQDQRQAYEKDLKSITKELTALLNASEHDSSQVWNYMYGKFKNLPRPYYIGHYVVSSLAAQRQYDLEGLMKASLEEYIDFTRAELLH